MHIISSNLHSVMNTLFAKVALKEQFENQSLEDIAEALSNPGNKRLRDIVHDYALEHGMYEISDNSGTNITVQLFDCASITKQQLPIELGTDITIDDHSLIMVMDYAFGEQAYESMDELLKPFEFNGSSFPFNVSSINIMGKAGILTGDKGDILIPTAHVFEGSADNYPFDNLLEKEMFIDDEIQVFEGPMITVLGTSLQNKDILRYFMNSSWRMIGLEMEGAHYQKAIQSASKIRHSVNPDIDIRYAYYASDNPLETGSTLASGSLGLDGVKPTYMITVEILKGIFKS